MKRSIRWNLEGVEYEAELELGAGVVDVVRARKRNGQGLRLRQIENRRRSLCRSCELEDCPAKRKRTCELTAWFRRPLATCPDGRWGPEIPGCTIQQEATA